MPLYEYACEACGRRFEIIHKFSDPPAETCRHCGSGPVHRLVSSPAIQFKGAGWYVTDYAQKGKSDTASPAPAAKSDDAKGDADKKAESAAKSESPATSTAPSSNGAGTGSKE